MSTPLEDMLIAKKVTPTPIRLMVLEYLLKQKAAVTLRDLESALERADRVTLYRTLIRFTENGLLHTIQDGTEVTRYALCEDSCTPSLHADAHIHFLCTRCSALYCLPKVAVPEIKLPENFMLQEVSLVARGTCTNCNQ